MTAFGAIALPDFALALILSYWVGVKLRWLPVAGLRPSLRRPRRPFQIMVLPAISLAVGQIAAYMRLLRSDMIATLAGRLHPDGEGEGHHQPPHPVAARAPAVEPHAAHRRRPQRRRADRRHGRDRGHLRPAGHGLRCCSRRSRSGSSSMLQSLVAIIAIGYVLVNVLHRPPVRHPRPEAAACSRHRLARSPRPSSRSSSPEPKEPGRRFRRPKSQRLGIGAWLALTWLVVDRAVSPSSCRCSCTRTRPPTWLPAIPARASSRFGPPVRHRRQRPRHVPPPVPRARGARCWSRSARSLFGLIVGGSLGLIAGYYQRGVDSVLSTFFNVLLAIPQFVLALALVTVFATTASTHRAISIRRRRRGAWRCSSSPSAS